MRMALRLGGLVVRQLGFASGRTCVRGPSFLRHTAGLNSHLQVPPVLHNKQCQCSYVHNTASCFSAVSVTAKTSQGDGSQESLSVDPEGQTLTVTWRDGSRSRFHSVWLRHNCHCSDCRQDHSTQRLTDPAGLPPQISIADVRMTGTQLEILWKGENQHVGRVSLDYLQQNCYESDSLRSKREAVKLDEPVKTLPEVHYNDLVKGDSMVLRWMKQINESGISLLKDVPTEDSMVRKIAENIGPVEDLIYGEIFDVMSNPQPINIAYSNAELDMHMDMVYYESPPGLQLLHCLRFDKCVVGGESRFLDVFHVAEEFRKSHPEHFSTLVRVPATFQKKHYDRDYPVEMKYQKPHIILNQYEEIVAVNWAPPFEGPLAVEQDDVMPYYAAYEAFAKAIKFSPHMVEYKLNPGDLVTFNNRRLLHARRSFDLNGGVRHLKGCNVNIDHFKSQVSVFSHLLGDAEPVKRVGNQDWF